MEREGYPAEVALLSTLSPISGFVILTGFSGESLF
jgi:hypothetical protein